MKKFIIHTNKYAGNFERQITAYITGHVGDCGVGSELVDNEIKRKFNSYIQQVDDDGCKRPTKIFPNPKYANNGLGYNFDKSNLEECKIAQQKHIDYITENKLNRLYEKLDFYQGTKYDVSRIETEIESLEAELNNYAQLPPMEIPTYDAYNSVCIFLSDDTPDEIITLMEERTHMYAKFHNADLSIEGFQVLNDEQVKDTDNICCDGDIKVKITAYNNHIIIETINYDDYDKDFVPCGNGRIGCSLNNTKRLGISEEALDLLCQIKNSHDAIGDFMWDENHFGWLGDENHFGWLGDVYAIKDLNCEGDRSFKVQNTFITIPNEVTPEQIEAVDKNSTPKIIDYNEVEFHPWLEFRSNANGTYHVSMSFHSSHCYGVTEIINAPDKCLKDTGDGDFELRISDEYREKICKKIYGIFGLEYNESIPNKFDEYIRRINQVGDFYSVHRISFDVKSSDLMNYLNRFFEIGFTNNIMYPSKDYWRLTYETTLEDYLKKLNKF